MVNNIDFELIKEIWNDADFKISKIPIKQTGEAIKKDKIRTLNEQGKIISYCKICNCEMYISTNYNGEFPLCKIHRDPNYRLNYNKK